MTYAQLVENIRLKRSFLCIGLDSDINLLPKILLKEEFPVYEFNKKIIQATHSYAVAYKPNLAFYESLGAAGWISLELTIDYIKRNHPEIFIIADAKRGDIGNTAKLYARTFFGNMDCDAITLAPYMGKDSVTPFLEYNSRWAIILALTSNDGSKDFQYLETENGRKLYQDVILTSKEWGSHQNMMYVVGATRAEMLKEIRQLIPNHFLLVPGVGAQGGSLQEVAQNGFNDHCGLLVNSSRAIIYADCTERFAEIAAKKAQEVQKEMEEILKFKKFV